MRDGSRSSCQPKLKIMLVTTLSVRLNYLVSFCEVEAFLSKYFHFKMHIAQQYDILSIYWGGLLLFYNKSFNWQQTNPLIWRMDFPNVSFYENTSRSNPLTFAASDLFSTTASLFLERTKCCKVIFHCHFNSSIVSWL